MSDKENLHIVYIGGRACLAEPTIMDLARKLDVIRDSIAHIEHRYTEHKELLRDISCMSAKGDCTAEIEYYINKIKDNCKYE